MLRIGIARRTSSGVRHRVDRQMGLIRTPRTAPARWIHPERACDQTEDSTPPMPPAVPRSARSRRDPAPTICWCPSRDHGIGAVFGRATRTVLPALRSTLGSSRGGASGGVGPLLDVLRVRLPLVLVGRRWQVPRLPVLLYGCSGGGGVGREAARSVRAVFAAIRSSARDGRRSPRGRSRPYRDEHGWTVPPGRRRRGRIGRPFELGFASDDRRRSDRWHRRLHPTIGRFNGSHPNPDRNHGFRAGERADPWPGGIDAESG